MLAGQKPPARQPTLAPVVVFPEKRFCQKKVFFKNKNVFPNFLGKKLLLRFTQLPRPA